MVSGAEALAARRAGAARAGDARGAVAAEHEHVHVRLRDARGAAARGARRRSPTAAVALSLEAAGAHRPSGDLGPYSSDGVRRRRGQRSVALRGRDPRAAAGLVPARGGRSGARRTSCRSAARRRCTARCSSAPRTSRSRSRTRSSCARRTRSSTSRPGRSCRTATSRRRTSCSALESVRLALAHVGRISARRTGVLSALARPLRAEGRAGIPGLLAYTAAERLNDLRRLAAPVSLDDVVLSEVEDYATWGWTAARTTHDAIDAADRPARDRGAARGLPAPRHATVTLGTGHGAARRRARRRARARRRRRGARARRGRGAGRRGVVDVRGGRRVRPTDRRPGRQQSQATEATGAVSGSGARTMRPSSVSTGRPSRAQYSKPPSISRTA